MARSQLDARLAGTTSRFITAVAALAPGPVTVDGEPALRRRPMGPLLDALVALGAVVSAEVPGHLPVTVTGPLVEGGRLALRGDVSSQYLTALMLIAPVLRGGLHVELTTRLVSRPYVELTAAVMGAFGVGGVVVDDQLGGRAGRPLSAHDATPSSRTPRRPAIRWRWRPSPAAASACRACDVRRPRATACSPTCWGRWVAASSRPTSACRSPRERDEPLRGIDVDMSDISDLVPTLAAVAATASTPTTITGVGFIRSKESDRLADLADELNKVGARVSVQPTACASSRLARLHGAVLDTHDDHRLAMAFGVLATVVEGIEVLDPGVVSKSWPDYWAVRDEPVLSDSSDRVPSDLPRCDLPRWSVRDPADRRPVVAAFDVDGTVTTRDCVVPFLRRVGGTVPIAARFGLSALRDVPALARRDRDRLKALAAKVVFTGRLISDVDRAGDEFAGMVAGAWIRPDTLARMHWHHDAGPRRRVRVGLVRHLPATPRPPPRRGHGRRVGTELAVDDRRPLHGRLRRRQLPRTGEGAAPARVAGGAPRRAGGRRAVGLRRLARRSRAAGRCRPRRCGSARRCRRCRGGPRDERGGAWCARARPKQWVKNILVFAAPGAAGVLDDWPQLGYAMLAFVAFCFAASGIYFWNDALDVDADRLHPTKRFRPVAAGVIGVGQAQVAGTICTVVALVVAAADRAVEDRRRGGRVRRR